MRQVVLDTETTGLEHKAGHRIIEIGCVEVINRMITNKNYHQYLQPERAIDQGAIEVHGITNEYLLDKPKFSEIMNEFMDFVDGAELVIHNASFDVGFINAELQWAGFATRIEDHCTILDTLSMAREMYPGQRNSLDALCKRLDISNSHRTLHGALLDSEILADVYLIMTGGQTALLLQNDTDMSSGEFQFSKQQQLDRNPTLITKASAEELQEHNNWLEKLATDSNSGCLWEEH